MNIARGILKVMGLAIIFAFVFIFATHIFYNIFIKHAPGYINNAIGAFMGAFFAFLFLRVADWMGKKAERKKKDQRALVRLEHLCNENANNIYDNISEIGKFTETARYCLKSRQLFRYVSRLQKIPLNREIPLLLTNLGLINELLSFNVDLIRVNRDIETLNRFFESIKGASLDGYHVGNINKLIEDLSLLDKFLQYTTERNKRILSIARVLLKNRNSFVCYVEFKDNRVCFSSKFEKLIIKEKGHLEKEMENVRNDSKVEIDKTLGK